MTRKKELNGLETSERKPSKGGVKIGSFCKDCLHYEACKAMDEEVDLTHLGLAKVCPRFKPKTRFEEVVRCKDCKNCMKVDDLDGGHWECIAHYDNHGRPYIPNLDGFCDCGEKVLKERESE